MLQAASCVCMCVCVACCKLRRVCVLHAARGAGFACGVHDEERVHHVPLRTHRPPLGSSAPTPRGRRPKAALGIGKRRASCLSDRMSWGQRGLEDRSDSHKQTSRRCFRGAALRDCRRGRRAFVCARACARRCLCLCACERRSDRGGRRTSIWSKSRCSDEPGANIEMKTVPTTARQQLHARAGSVLTPPTSAPELGSPLPHLHRNWAHPCHICARTGLNPPTSALGLGSPLPHPHRDWAHPSHICTVSGLTPAISTPDCVLDGIYIRWCYAGWQVAACRRHAKVMASCAVRIGTTARMHSGYSRVLAGTRVLTEGPTLLGW
jgi:hypothetical protein